MHKLLISLVAAGMLAAAAVAVPSTANAQCRGCGVAAGLIGGLAAGTIIGSAIAHSPPPPPYYYGPPPGPVYAGPGPGCYWTRGEPYWDGYRWYSPRVQVCP